MKAYSADLRQRIVSAYEQGVGTSDELADVFSIARRSVARYVKLHHAGESLQPKPRGGGVPFSLAEKHLTMLQAQVGAKNDITLAELVAHLAGAERVMVHPSTVCRALQRLGLPRKKRVLPLRNVMKKPERCFASKFPPSRANSLCSLTKPAFIWQWRDATDAPPEVSERSPLSPAIAA